MESLDPPSSAPTKEVQPSLQPQLLHRHDVLYAQMMRRPPPSIPDAAEAPLKDCEETGPKCIASKAKLDEKDFHRALLLSTTPAAHDMNDLRKELVNRAKAANTKLTKQRRARLVKFEKMLQKKVEGGAQGNGEEKK